MRGHNESYACFNYDYYNKLEKTKFYRLNFQAEDSIIYKNKYYNNYYTKEFKQKGDYNIITNKWGPEHYITETYNYSDSLLNYLSLEENKINHIKEKKGKKMILEIINDYMVNFSDYKKYLYNDKDFLVEIHYDKEGKRKTVYHYEYYQ